MFATEFELCFGLIFVFVNVYPNRTNSTEFQLYTRRGLAGSVLIGRGGQLKCHAQIDLAVFFFFTL